jgi:ATP-dependent RNA helicase RhlE
VQEGTDIIVATPGRFYDLAMNGAFRTKTLKHLVIDEVDEMLNLGFRSQIKNILDLLPPRRQNLLFSATLLPEVHSLMNVYFNDPVQIEAAPAGTRVEEILQVAYYVPNFHTKINLLSLMLDSDIQMSKVLVFTATRKMADQLFENIEIQYPGSGGVIHSNKDQNHRFNTVRKFKDGTYRFIIATDIVARGIDVSEVTHVVNFDLPEIPENYLHRIGRTGRAGKHGIAISFVLESEKNRLEEIGNFLQSPVPLSELPENLTVSHQLTEDELPKANLKEIKLKIAKKEQAGPSFHEKSAKNKKVNFTVSRKDKMMKKYGKPKTRGQKK